MVLHNDSDDEVTGQVNLRRERLDGTVLASVLLDVQVAARSAWSAPIAPTLGVPVDTTREVLIAQAPTGERGLHYFADDTSLALEDAMSVEARDVADGYEVTATARTLVKDATLLVDLVDPTARVDSGMVTLTAGEQHVFRVSAPAGIDPSAFTRAGVLRTANDLVARAVAR